MTRMHVGGSDGARSQRCRLLKLMAEKDDAVPRTRMPSLVSWRRALAEFIDTSTDATNATLLEVATRHLGGLKDPKARPTLFKMLKHPDAHVRVSAITAVASLLNPSDVDALLAATLALPDYHLSPAIVALFPFREAQLVEPLVQRASTISDPMIRRVVNNTIAKLQKAIESE